MPLISAIAVRSPVAFDFTEHNRSTLNFGYEQIESIKRTANGTMRKFIVAQKRSFDVSWSMLPSDTALVVDGKGGAGAIKNFYESNVGKSLTIDIIHHEDSVAALSSVAVGQTPATKETLTVFISSFSYEVVKRMPYYDYVNVSIGFVEV